MGLYPKGRDEWEEERRPEKMMDALRKRARRAQLGRTWRWGVLCAAGPSPVPRLPIPSPLHPDAPLQPPFPSKYFGVISNGTSLEHFVPNGTLTSQLFLMGLPLVNMRIIGSH